MEPRARAAAISVLSNVTLVISKLAIGVTMGSVSVLSEAAHSGTDLLAALIAYVSVLQASKPADREHQYGHGKIENVSAVAEAVLILVAAGWITWEAVNRLLHGARLEALGLGIGVMAASSLVNVGVSRYLFGVAHRTDSVALRADAMHLSTDVWTSTGVLVGLVLVRLTGWHWLDSVAALIAAGLMVRAAWELTRESFYPLLDHRLPEVEEQAIQEIIARYQAQYVNVHRLRTRRSGAERHVDLHLVVHRNATLERAHELCTLIENDIRGAFPRTQVLIHAEPCSPDCAQCYVTHDA